MSAPEPGAGVAGPFPTFDAYLAKYRADYRKLSRTKEQLQSIQAPTIVADGDHDEIIELAHVEEMAQLIPHARLEVFADTSHFALWQDPTSFNKVLVDFLVPPEAK